MDCLNCFAPPRPSSNSYYPRRDRLSHLNTFRDPPIYNTRAPRYINRPPTPYPYQEHFTSELLTPRRAYTRPYKRHVSQRTVDDATVVWKQRFQPIAVEVEHISASEDKLGGYDTGIKSPPRRRRAVSFQDRWGAQLQANIAAQNDRISSRSVPARKSVALQEPFRGPELQKQIAAQNDKIRRRPVPMLTLPRPVTNYPYVDDISIAFSDLRLSSHYKR
jgi:hypothetical protein